MQKFLFNTVGFDKATATYIIAAALLWFTAMQPVFGALADEIWAQADAAALRDRRRDRRGTDLHDARDRHLALYRDAARHDPADIASGYSANNALVKAELFPAHIRGLGVALPYAIGNAIFAGTLEMVALALKDAGVERVFYFYVAFVIAMAGVATLLLPETKERSLIVED